MFTLPLEHSPHHVAQAGLTILDFGQGILFNAVFFSAFLETHLSIYQTSGHRSKIQRSVIMNMLRLGSVPFHPSAKGLDSLQNEDFLRPQQIYGYSNQMQIDLC